MAGSSDATRTDLGRAGSIAELIRLGRIRKGWNQAELAEHAGVSRTTLIHIERGAVQDPRTSTLSKLSQALELAPEVLALRRPLSAPPQPPADAPAPPLEYLSEQTAFDWGTNPSIAEAVARDPQRFRAWTDREWSDLAGTFGVGGPLTVDGVLRVADRINADRETLTQLRIVLQTHLREPAQQLIEALYQSVSLSTPATPFASPTESPRRAQET